jgi:hypothetical protein
VKYFENIKGFIRSNLGYNSIDYGSFDQNDSNDDSHPEDEEVTEDDDAKTISSIGEQDLFNSVAPINLDIEAPLDVIKKGKLSILKKNIPNASSPFLIASSSNSSSVTKGSSKSSSVKKASESSNQKRKNQEIDRQRKLRPGKVDVGILLLK